jgi:hypothetical protein
MREPSQLMNATVVPNSSLRLACRTVAIWHGGYCDASSLVMEPSPVVLATLPPDRCGFVPLKQPQRANNFPCCVLFTLVLSNSDVCDASFTDRASRM